MMRAALAALALIAPTSVGSREPAGLHEALQQLTRDGRFSGAVVIRGSEGVRFARGCGMADPFTGRAFRPDTPVDSASLAKPVTAAAVLVLASEGKLDLDAPVRRYLREYPYRQTTVRHLLAHSAGLAGEESEKAIAGKTNAQLLSQLAGQEPTFTPGSAFAYCNFCYTTLALLIERISGQHYLDFVREHVALAPGVMLRPAHLSDWTGRAIGYRPTPAGRLERFDSWEGELFYGSGNFSLSAAQLAQWGAEWWQSRFGRIRTAAMTTAMIAGKPSGLTLGNWYCAPDGRRCHYLGHHEGFHHMLYWDAERRISIAMVTNNTLAAALQQRLQRALVTFAEGRPADARKEIARPLGDMAVTSGLYLLSDGDTATVRVEGNAVHVTRRGIEYRAFRIGDGIRYIPGLDVYVARSADADLRWLSLYEDYVGKRVSSRRR